MHSRPRIARHTILNLRLGAFARASIPELGARALFYPRAGTGLFGLIYRRPNGSNVPRQSHFTRRITMKTGFGRAMTRIGGRYIIAVMSKPSKDHRTPAEKAAATA